jgi:hypothetical protein
MGRLKETSMSAATRHPYGVISAAEAERMRPNLPAHLRPVLDLLTARPPVRASAPDDDGGDEVDEEFAGLWAPRTAREHERRARIAASARAARDLDDDDANYERIFADQP